MNKPFTIKVQETEEKLVDILNKSELPAYVIKTLLQNLYAQVETIDNEEIKKYKEKKVKESDK